MSRSRSSRAAKRHFSICVFFVGSQKATAYNLSRAVSGWSDRRSFRSLTVARLEREHQTAAILVYLRPNSAKVAFLRRPMHLPDDTHTSASAARPLILFVTRALCASKEKSRSSRYGCRCALGKASGGAWRAIESVHL